MEFLQDYGLFLAKTATLVLAALAIVALAAGIRGRGRARGHERLEVRRLNDRYRDMARRIEHGLAGRHRARRLARAWKREGRSESRGQPDTPRLFVMDFEGDIRATAVDHLREEISAAISAAREGDEVMIRVESAGGLVHSYGLAASQLARLREHGIRLTVCVDRIAASGGYLMACVADHVVAAPFAIVGSIGVVGQVPNFHRLLKEHNVDYELHTAGEYKRTLTVFGENTEQGRVKFRENLEEMHALFKHHIARHRPQVAIDKVATGEYWLGERARELDLVDAVGTSDDFLLERRERMELVALHYYRRRPLARRLTIAFETAIGRLLGTARE